MGMAPRIGSVQTNRMRRYDLFLREYMANGNIGAQAWLAVNPKASAARARVWSCRLLRKPFIKQGYQELTDRMARKADITVEKVLTDYQLALDLAKAQEKPADIVNAA